MSEARPSLGGFPANLVVAGRRCLVVGGGRIARRKLDGLLAAGAEVVVVAPEVVAEIAELASADRITWRRRGFVEGDLEDVWLAITATGEPAVDAEVLRGGGSTHLGQLSR